jgi:hypothetical protein
VPLTLENVANAAGSGGDDNGPLQLQRRTQSPRGNFGAKGAIAVARKQSVQSVAPIPIPQELAELRAKTGQVREAGTRGR